MGSKRKITQQEAAKLVITSKRMAELFIKRFMDRHQSTRKAAKKRLQELGIEISQLSD